MTPLGSQALSAAPGALHPRSRRLLEHAAVHALDGVSVDFERGQPETESGAVVTSLVLRV